MAEPASLPARPEFSGGNGVHKRKRANRERPKEKIDLGDGWIMVVSSWGRRFVHFKETGESFWTVPDYVQKKIDALDKDEVVKLIAKARGLRLDEDGNVAPRQKRDTKQEEPEAPEEPVEVSVGERKFAIVEEDEDGGELVHEEPEEPEEPEEEESSDDDLGTGFNVAELMDEPEVAEVDTAAFETMLDEYNVNPMNAWEMERDKVINDDRYEVYDSNRARSDAFAEWARKKIEAKRGARSEPSGGLVDFSDSEGEEEHNDNEPELDEAGEFLAFLAANYKPKKFYVDFKRKHRKDPGFDTGLNDKDKERLYREYASLMKKSDDDRAAEFAKLLETHKFSGSFNTVVTGDPRYHAVSEAVRRDTAAKLAGHATRETSEAARARLAERQRAVEEERRRALSGLRRERAHQERDLRRLDEATYNIDREKSLRNLR